MQAQLTIDSNGTNVVILPLKEWEKMKRKAVAFDEHRKFYKDLRNSLKEVKEIQEGKKTAKSLADFLHELQN